MIAVILAVVLTVLLWWGNTSIKTTNISISSERIPVELNGFTIAHISDLHNTEFGDSQVRLLKAVKEAAPNIIAVTGDLIDSYHTDVDKAMSFINGAVSIAPVYFVAGNHEARSFEYKDLKKEMLNAGVHILEDESTVIEYAGVNIQILGMNDPNFKEYYDEMQAKFDEKLKEIIGEGNNYKILLSHRPELFNIYVDNNIDLVLTGHAHGGQVRLPVLGGIIAPNQGFFPDYTQGVYEKNQTKMIVSRGLGNSIIPLRVNNRPELVIATLTA